MSNKIIKWDSDGYPTKESLKQLEKALNDKDTYKAINAFYSALKENFYKSDFCGLTKAEVRGSIIDVWAYHTGGWSGNESIIRILKQSPWWSSLLERYDSGGHYYFKLINNDNKK